MAEVVISAAILDLCHEGHLNLLENLRKAAGKVILVLHDDKSCFEIKGRFPIQTVEHRARNALSTGLVDDVVITKSPNPGAEFDQIIRDNWDKTMIFMRGDDNINYPGREVIDSYQIDTVFIPYTKGVSSSILRGKISPWD